MNVGGPPEAGIYATLGEKRDRHVTPGPMLPALVCPRESSLDD